MVPNINGTLKKWFCEMIDDCRPHPDMTEPVLSDSRLTSMTGCIGSALEICVHPVWIQYLALPPRPHEEQSVPSQSINRGCIRSFPVRTAARWGDKAEVTFTVMHQGSKPQAKQL